MAYVLDVWERVGLDEFVRIHGRESVLARVDKALSGELDGTHAMRRFRAGAGGEKGNEMLAAARRYLNI